MIQFSKKLLAARKMRGWSLEELSQNMGDFKISPQALNKFEKGELPLSEETLYHLCKALNVKQDFFYRTTQANIEKVSFRKLDSFPVKMQDKVVALTADFVERYLELEELLSISPKFNIRKYTGYKINSPEDIENAANFIRKEWKLGQGSLYNVVEILEDNHIKVFEMKEDDGFQGLSLEPKKDGIVVIVLNVHDKIPTCRKRFTALHELGHIVMDIAHLPEKTQEEYCHHFAGAMLIPKEKLIEEVGAKRTNILISELGQLKKQYGISISALLFRLKDCNIISSTYCFQMMNEMRRQGIFEREPKEYDYKGEEHSNRFLQLLLRGISMELISTSKAATLNNQKLYEFRNLIDFNA